MKKYLFGAYLLLSFIVALSICNANLPIEDEMTNSLNSLRFLSGEAILLGSISSAGALFYKGRKERIILAIFTAVLLLLLYTILYSAWLTVYLRIAEGFFVLLIVGSIHYFISFLLRNLLIKP
ncbi:hypothetical protein BEP19_04435 [Ammoniphilus oxalaticus]|uniref:Uncharacterized protein n=1 Tax=Ammoniphilus oxalaticus TaxID=66863 RepID=A0A419SM34_9BACL|nr:hypothetical protein [Ammoniphilus oxalaticus]RKD25075.1 hypothetical protein BEP19_04435 [Ammoniphilus oxalaticus]